jgi:amino acid transporter
MAITSEEAVLEALGQKSHQMRRNMSLWETFALGFTYLSPVVGVYSLFAFALRTGGPVVIWAVVIAMLGQLLVAMLFGEMVSQIPIAGGIYPWCKRLWGNRYAWMSAWLYFFALAITEAAVTYGLGQFIAPLLGLQPSKEITVITAIVLVVVVTLLNLGGAQLMSRIAQIGFTAEIVGAIIVGITLLAFHREQDWTVIFNTYNVSHDSPYWIAFVSAGLLGIYLFYGFAACGDVAEEVVDPGRKAPRAMRMTIYIGGAASLLLVYALLLAVPNYQAVFSGKVTNPITSILKAVFGDIGYRIVLIVVLMSFLSCALSLQAAASRVVYSFSRDKMIPFDKVFSRVTKRSGVPGNALLLAGSIPIILILITLASPQALDELVSFAAFGIYIVFSMVTVASLRQKFKGWRPSGKFNLGFLTIPVGICAIIYQCGAMLDLVWPRGGDYFVIIASCVIIIAGLIVMALIRPFARAGANIQGGDIKEITEALNKENALYSAD